MAYELKLADDYTFEIEEGASLNAVIHKAVTEAEALDVCEKLTPENVSHLRFIVDGQVTGDFENIILNYPPHRYKVVDEEIGEQWVEVLMSFREKTEVELRLDALENSQSIQDGAIEDLGTVVSEIVGE